MIVNFNSLGPTGQFSARSADKGKLCYYCCPLFLVHALIMPGNYLNCRFKQGFCNAKVHLAAFTSKIWKIKFKIVSYITSITIYVWMFYLQGSRVSHNTSMTRHGRFLLHGSQNIDVTFREKAKWCNKFNKPNLAKGSLNKTTDHNNNFKQTCF